MVFRRAKVEGSAQPRRRFSVLKSCAGLLALMAGTWLVLAIYPRPLFAYELQRGNLVLHARTPLPEQTAALLDGVLSRLQRSPLYDPARVEHAYLCNSARLHQLLTLGGRGSGLTNPWRNVFIRSADVATGAVFDTAGKAKDRERTLTYVLTHEFTHALTFARYGFWHSRQLAAFQREGYADYVGFARPLALREQRAALQRDEPELDPKRTGLYLRYELFVAYLLERKGLSVDELFARPISPADVLSELNADPTL